MDLSTGSIRGAAYADAIPFEQQQIRFAGVLEEGIEVTFPDALPVPDRLVAVRVTVAASFTAEGVAIANGIYFMEVNNRRGSVLFGSDVDGGWSAGSQDPGVTSGPTSEGYFFQFDLDPGTTGIAIESQLEGTARAYANLEPIDEAHAGVVATNTAVIELILPEGATFTSDSGFFLVPEPAGGVLLVTGAAVLAARRRALPTVR